MNRIPITFEQDGKKYNGFFNHISGEGEDAAYHLYDLQNFFLGRLKKENNEYVFDSTPDTTSLKSLADFSVSI